MLPSEVVGRDREARTLREAVRKHDRVAVVGPGGAGKSALVRHVLESAWRVDLTGCAAPTDVLERIAGALGTPLAGDDAERLGRLLGREGRIVVLDGCEAVLDGVIDIVAAWDARVVLTTRIRPRGWEVVEVGPLGMPTADTLEAVLASAAGALFVERGRRANPRWAPHAAEAPAIAALLRRLDGLPLALELAAARLATLGTRQLLEHLGERFALLRDGDTSLAAVLESSLALLAGDDRALLRRLAAFHGGFGIEAVAAMEGVAGIADAIARIEAFTAHSLVRAWEGPALPGVRWYALYDSVRELLREPGGPLPDAWVAAHGLELAGRTGGPEPRPALESLAMYAGDLRAAFDRGDPAIAGAAALALDVLYKTRGPGDARRALLERAVHLGGPHGDALILTAIDARVVPPDDPRVHAIAERGEARERAWALRSIARELAATGAGHDAIALAERAVALDPGEPRNLVALAEVHALRGERVDAVRAYHRALAAAEHRHARRDEAAVLGFLAMSEHDLGDGPAAGRHARRAIDALDALGETRRAAVLAQVLGEISLDAGALDEADRAFADALARLESVGEPRWRSYCLAGRAMARALGGDTGGAREAFRLALTEARKHDTARQQGVIAAWAATSAAVAGHPDEARALLAEATDPSPKTGHLRALASLAVDRDPPEARRARLAALDRSGWAAEARILARWIERLLEASDGVADLRLGEATAWVEVPGSSRRSLVRHHANRRILERLVRAHRESPGAAVSLEGLLEAGWPDEQVLAEAGAARVYTALSTLRRWGLRSLIEKADGGYRLRPDARIDTSV